MNAGKNPITSASSASEKLAAIAGLAEHVAAGSAHHIDPDIGTARAQWFGFKSNDAFRSYVERTASIDWASLAAGADDYPRFKAAVESVPNGVFSTEFMNSSATLAELAAAERAGGTSARPAGSTTRATLITGAGPVNWRGQAEAAIAARGHTPAQPRPQAIAAFSAKSYGASSNAERAAYGIAHGTEAYEAWKAAG